MIVTEPAAERQLRRLWALLSDPASWVGGVIPEGLVEQSVRTSMPDRPPPGARGETPIPTQSALPADDRKSA